MFHSTARCVALFIAFVSLSLTSTANAWSIFGPSTFEDCVLANMKGVSSDAAAGSIRLACRKKFPQKDEQSSPKTSTRSGSPRVDIWDKPYNSKIFSNIKLGAAKYNQYNAYEIPITNKTNINITGIYLGVPANKNTCSIEKADYIEIYECSVDIYPNTTKTAFCSMPRTSFCISGIKAAYEADVDKFFKDIAQ